MPQTAEGVIKAKKTIIDKYGADYWGRIGSKGGSVHRPETRYFYIHRDVASRAGAIGGTISRRKPKNG